MSPADADNAVTYAVLIVLAIVVAGGLALWAAANAAHRSDQDGDEFDAQGFGGTESDE